MELNDEDCPKTLRDYVRTNPNGIQVYRYIKRGNIGEVYFGQRKKLNDHVVLKFYDGTKDYDSSEEAVILRQIDHPNILKVLHLEFVKPYYSCFLSPMVSGGDLQGLIEEGPIPTKTSLEIITGILSGITELHSKHRMVHRDLKPGNILLDLEFKRPIIADLGAVRKIGSGEKFVSASKATKYYLPPEAILENRFYFQSDIYQIGIILYQLLGGYFPIDNPYRFLSERERKQIEAIRNSDQQYEAFQSVIDEKIVKGKLFDLNTLPSYLDNSFKKVLRQALNIDYKKRYSDSSKFLTQIHQLIRSCPNYVSTSDCLIILHNNGKQCKISESKSGKYILERSSDGQKWRKDKLHDGTFEGVIAKAKN